VVEVVLAEVDAADHARLHQELEGAVDRGPGDLETLLLHLEEKLVGLEVVVGGEDLPHQGGSLVGELQTLGGEEALELVDFALDDGHDRLRLSLSYFIVMRRVCQGSTGRAA